LFKSLLLFYLRLDSFLSTSLINPVVPSVTNLHPYRVDVTCFFRDSAEFTFGVDALTS